MSVVKLKLSGKSLLPKPNRLLTSNALNEMNNAVFGRCRNKLLFGAHPISIGNGALWQVTEGAVFFDIVLVRFPGFTFSPKVSNGFILVVKNTHVPFRFDLIEVDEDMYEVIVSRQLPFVKVLEIENGVVRRCQDCQCRFTFYPYFVKGATFVDTKAEKTFSQNGVITLNATTGGIPSHQLIFFNGLRLTENRDFYYVNYPRELKLTKDLDGYVFTIALTANIWKTSVRKFYEKEHKVLGEHSVTSYNSEYKTKTVE